MAGNTTSQTPIIHAKENILGMTISLEQRFGLTPKRDKGTTLNTKFSTFQDKLPVNPTYTKFFSWGVKGRRNDTDNLASAQFVAGTNMALYGMRPFRAVPFEQDLSAPERAKYALREVRTINGVPYCLYWLKKMQFPQSEVQYVRTDPGTGERSQYDFNYGNLSPTAPVADVNGVVTDVADTISAIVPAIVTLTGEEVYESISVMDGGDPRYAICSELGFVSASTESVTVSDFAGQIFSYDEAIFARMMDHYCWTGFTFEGTESVMTRDIAFQLKNLINQS